MLGNIEAVPWWALAILVQISIVGIVVAGVFYLKSKQAGTALAKVQARLQQQLEQATMHKHKIAEMELQLESLDAFQEMYFELQEQHEKLTVAHEEFSSKANELLSDEDQAKLQTTLYQLQVERDKLEQKLQKVGASLQHILEKQNFSPTEQDAAGKAAQAAVDEVDNEIQAIGDVIEQQQRLIEELKQRLASLQIEVDGKQELEAMIAQLKQQNGQMGATLADMQQQNQALSQQVAAMQVSQRAADSEAIEQVKQLQHALDEKEKAYDALYKKYTAIEAEYQNIYAKTQKIRA